MKIKGQSAQLPCQRVVIDAERQLNLRRGTMAVNSRVIVVSYFVIAKLKLEYQYWHSQD